MPKHPSADSGASRNDVVLGQGLTLDEGVTWMIAEDAGLNGRALALAGQAAQPVLRLMRAAAQAKTAGKRKALVTRARDALRKVNPAHVNTEAYESLLEQVTNRMAEQTGEREEDATPSINPATGLQEFAGQTAQAPLPARNPTHFSKSIILPVAAGVERNDADGHGWYGASRDGGRRQHKGVDITANAPGDPVFAPIEGVVEKHGWTDNNLTHQIVNIRGTGTHDGLKFRLFYVDPGTLKPGTPVLAGDQIGTYQDFKAAYPARKNMRHHVHVESLYDGKHIDPSLLLPNWTSSKP